MIITKKRNYKKKIIVSLIVILIISGAGAGAYWYLDNNDVKKNSENTSSTEEETQDNSEVAEEVIVYKDMSSKDAYELINKSEISIIDVSPEYENGHLPGSINYYVGDGSLDNAVTELDKEKTYLVYCHSDSASILGAQTLIDAGFTKVNRLIGNYGLWKSDGYPIEVNFGGVGSYKGSVTATRSYLDGEFTHTLLVKDSEPEDGMFFEGWLTGDGTIISTGKLESTDAGYELSFTSSEDNRNLTNIVVTEETEANGLDGISEEHIFEGSF